MSELVDKPDGKTPDYKTSLLKNGFLAFVPKGNSMWPTLKNGKQSVVLLPKKERLKVMDVAMYLRPDGTFVLHRVIELTDDGYVFVGDSMPLSLKETVKEEQVFGVLTGYYKKRRYITTEDGAFNRRGAKLFKHDKLRLFRFRVAIFLSSVKRKIKKLFTFRKGKQG